MHSGGRHSGRRQSDVFHSQKHHPAGEVPKGDDAAVRTELAHLDRAQESLEPGYSVLFEIPERHRPIMGSMNDAPTVRAPGAGLVREKED